MSRFLIAFSKRQSNTIDMFQNDAPGLTWHHLVRSAMEKMGGEAKLTDLYSYLAEHPKSKKNEHYKERIRATRRVSRSFVSGIRIGRRKCQNFIYLS